MSVTVKSKLPAIADDIAPRMERAALATAEIVADKAKTRVPVDEGDLRDAIHVQREGVGEYAVIAGDRSVFYGHMVEHGTTHTAPRPFLIPALEDSVSEAHAIGTVAMRSL